MKKVLHFIYTLIIVAATIAQTPEAYYSFNGNANDAVGILNGMVNGALFTTDYFGNANSAYVFNGTISGNNSTLANSPARVTCCAAIGNASNQDYLNAKKTTSLTRPAGESITVTSSFRHPEGVELYRIDEQPDALTGRTGADGNTKYFNVFEAGGTAPQYTR